MAFLAGYDGVVSDQGKSRDVMVKGRYAAPIVLAMASLAANAELAIMPIILAVARRTCGRQLVAIEIARVARVALDLCMCGLEWKFRVLVVIEAHHGPLVLFVAGFAPGAVTSAMDILNSVAIDTRHADSFVAFANMARRARDIAVRTLQGKLGLLVVKCLRAPPFGFAVTIVARFSQAPLMGIVGLMAIEAASRGIAELYILCVTAVALHSLVGIPQFEIRGCVIECLTVEEDDISISPLVIGVTMGAFLFYGICLASVNPPE
jgi:hypothetical protein